MNRKTVALSLNPKIYEAYKAYCEKNHMVISRKIEALMKKELDDQDGK